MKRSLYCISAAVVVVLFILKNTDGYKDWPTQINNSEQANDNYLESMLKAAGFQGKYVVPPNPNTQESIRLNNTLRANGYAEIPMSGEIQVIKTEFSVPSTPQETLLKTNPYTNILLFLFVSIVALVIVYLIFRAPNISNLH